jgi:3-hydroxyacyl-CoA dehydrogenase/3-hydroxy-2-methylbutyryl-CoA dehydrogenase
MYVNGTTLIRDKNYLLLAHTISCAQVTNESNVTAALDIALSKFGKLNTVVNCAGIGAAEKTLGKKGPHSLDNFMRVLQVNTAGTFNMIRLASERMAENDPSLLPSHERGCIINTASIAAYDGQIGQAAYAASKGSHSTSLVFAF